LALLEPNDELAETDPCSGRGIWREKGGAETRSRVATFVDTNLERWASEMVHSTGHSTDKKKRKFSQNCPSVSRVIL